MVRVMTVDRHGFVYLATREDWFARNPVDRVTVIRPFDRVVISTTGTAQCGSRTQCVSLLQSLQDQHMAEGSWDIRPSFLIGGYGTIYEGRGWSSLPEQVQNNTNSLEIALLGDFGNTVEMAPPPYEMIASALTLIKFGLRNDFIKHDYKIAYKFPTRVQSEENPLWS